ncbi:NTP transferase domain-containing protein, partial [Limimaricola soesokkakensis]|uniref:NTP transferase domain-containing protein n=1 Tax=Limimaricola soesokkakensis TaxID=1343159 RepID=UPI003515FC9C
MHSSVSDRFCLDARGVTAPTPAIERELHVFPLLILAAGRSSRMRGADKLAQEINGVPLLRRQVAAA